ncbi:MAG: NADH-quinone oxidoreductase subunit M [Verrucomicrobia bacterium]|nr:NADH-quinone oxidoreductase subunit M [Verrucomicrobiota bacterium]
MTTAPLLTLLSLTPLVGGLVVLFTRKEAARKAALGFSGLALFEALHLLLRFNSATPQMQFEEEHAWIPALQVHYHLGIDGLGLLMVLLSALVVPMAQLLSSRSVERPHVFHALVLFLQAGLFGTFTALNFFHWFIFWELSLIPAYFLIKLWGGPQRVAAATQFFLYTLVGSVAMLVAFQAIYLATDSFDFQVLAKIGSSGELAAKLGQLHLGGITGHSLVMLVFAGVLLGFAVKVPMMPFHTWLPSAYAEAPSSVTMLLTGAMSKMGVYGLLRLVLPLFPAQVREWQTPLLWLAVGTIVLSACAAFAQKDLKRMLAYSSVNHLGYCLLGIFAVAGVTGTDARWSLEKAAALNGVLLQMFNHGITAAALFGFVALIEQRSGGLCGLDDFGGLRNAAPVLTGLVGIALFASIGLPGLSGFVGEFLIFKGAFALVPWAAALSALGLLMTAVFLLTLVQRVFHGPLNERWSGFADLTWPERLMVTPALGLMFLLGIWPQLVISFINTGSVQAVAWLAR